MLSDYGKETENIENEEESELNPLSETQQVENVNEDVLEDVKKVRQLV